MKLLPILALTAVSLSHSAAAEPEAAPVPAPAQAEAAARATSTVDSLSDAECLAVASYMHRLEQAAMLSWVEDWQIGGGATSSLSRFLAEVPAEGVPDDFLRYMQEYGALMTAFSEKRNELSLQMRETKPDDAWDISRQITQLDKKLREDKLALAARYSRASLLGTGWESKASQRARNDLRLRTDSARAYLETAPLAPGEKPDNTERMAAYLQYLCAQPQAELTPESARRCLERMEILKQLDPSWRLEQSQEFLAIPEGTVYAVRLPQDDSTGCVWTLADEPTEESPFSVEWQRVPTSELKKSYPHGKGVQTANPRPSTTDTMVALVQLRKAGTVQLRFLCKQGDKPIATKLLTFYVRRAGDYRPLNETDPLPEPEPAAPPMAPGVATLTDEECLALQRYLQMLFCHTAEECAKAVEEQQHLQVPIISADVLPNMLLNCPKLPQDFHDYQVEHHHLYIGIRATSRALDRKEHNYRYGKGITREQRRELREEHKRLQEREEAMWKTLQEKYPRAIILRNAGALAVIDDIYRSYNRTDARAKRFFAEHPEMRDAIVKLSKSSYFRYLAEERRKEELSVATARRMLERLDTLRAMNVVLEGESTRHFYGREGGQASALILPAAASTGFSWKLEAPLTEEAPVRVEWHSMERQRLQKLREMGLLHHQLPLSEELMVASIHMQKPGSSELRFVCTRAGDEEPLMVQPVSLKIQANEDEEADIGEAPLPPVPATEAASVGSFTDAECLTIANCLHRIRMVHLLAVADSIEEEEPVNDADFARLAAAELPDELPADLRDFVHASSELISSTGQKLAAVREQVRELRQSGVEDVEEAEKPLRRQYLAILRQHEKDTGALRARYPRAIFLSSKLGSEAANTALQELAEESERVNHFLAAHPKLKKGKRATAIAWLRHLGNEPAEPMTAESARDLIRKQDLLTRLNMSMNGVTIRSSTSTGSTEPLLLPHDAASGYSWQLATPLPEDAPVELTWHPLPSAELRELQARGILAAYPAIPESPEVVIASCRAVRPGKVTLEFIYSRPGDAKPLLNMTQVLNVESDEEDE